MNIRESAYSERRTKSGARCVSNKTVRKYENLNIRESAYSERRTKSGARCVSNKTVRKYKHKSQFSHTISDKNSEFLRFPREKIKNGRMRV